MTPEIAQAMSTDCEIRLANITRHWDNPVFDAPIVEEYQVPKGDVKLITKVR